MLNPSGPYDFIDVFQEEEEEVEGEGNAIVLTIVNFSLHCRSGINSYQKAAYVFILFVFGALLSPVSHCPNTRIYFFVYFVYRVPSCRYTMISVYFAVYRVSCTIHWSTLL
jgi:hypothetical protein